MLKAKYHYIDRIPFGFKFPPKLLARDIYYALKTLERAKPFITFTKFSEVKNVKAKKDARQKSDD